MRRSKLAIVVSIVVALGGASAQAQSGGAQSSGSAADIAFWNSVKDSKSAAEVQAYIDKFPGGTFVDLAKLRLKSLQGASSAPAAKPSLPAAPGSSDVLRMVQDKLYNLNYDVPVRDGRMNAETRQAIADWRSNIKSTTTGDLTPNEIAALNGVVTSKIWGAVAYNVRGGSSTVWNVGSRDEAKAAVLAGCKKLNGGTCNVLTAASTGCMAVTYSSGTLKSTVYSNAYAVVRPSLAEATDVALTTCRSKARVPANCGIRTTVCANGSHKK